MGLLTSGVVFQLYGSIRKDEVVEAAGRFNIRFGFWCLFPVILVGFLGMLSLEDKTKFKDFLSSHLKFALITVAMFFSAILVSKFIQKPWGRVLYLVIVTLGGACILSTGYFGGELVHRFGVSAQGVD